MNHFNVCAIVESGKVGSERVGLNEKLKDLVERKKVLVFVVFRKMVQAALCVMFLMQSNNCDKGF